MRTLASPVEMNHVGPIEGESHEAQAAGGQQNECEVSAEKDRQHATYDRNGEGRRTEIERGLRASALEFRSQHEHREQPVADAHGGEREPAAEPSDHMKRQAGRGQSDERLIGRQPAEHQREDDPQCRCRCDAREADDDEQCRQGSRLRGPERARQIPQDERET